MSKFHQVESVRVDANHLHLTVDGQKYRVSWADCSETLVKASPSQRRRIEVSPSGYGLSWPELDEDLALTPLLKHAAVVTRKTAGKESALTPA